MTRKPARPMPDPQAAPPRSAAAGGSGQAGGSGHAGGSEQAGGSEPAGGSEQRVRDGDVTLATFGYLGVIFLGPVIPLIVYAIKARKSQFIRYHAATAVNLSITGALYALCCLILGGLLLLDNIAVALIVVLPIGFLIWVSMLRYLIRGVSAANRGERNEVPSWICARIVS